MTITELIKELEKFEPDTEYEETPFCEIYAEYCG